MRFRCANGHWDCYADYRSRWRNWLFLRRHQNRNRDRTNHRLCDAVVCHGTQRTAVERSGRPMALGSGGHRIGFVGVMLVLQPFGQGFQWVMVLPLFAAFCYGTNLVTVRLFDRDVKTLLINNYSSWSAVVISLVFVLAFSDTSWQARVSAWWPLAGVGICGGLGIYFISAGYREVEPSKVAPFDYFGLIYAMLFGWLIFGEAPFDRLFPGVLLIVGAGLLIVWREQVRRQSDPNHNGR